MVNLASVWARAVRGRSVAWGAQLFGCRCVLYIHATVSVGRRAAIAHYGAEVIHVERAGGWDDHRFNATPHIFPHINRSMTSYLERHLSLSTEEANALRMQYWHQYGATLLGLMRHHTTDPHHFLHETHSFERLHKMMVFDRALKGMLKKLPGRKIVFSNAPRKYAEAVLNIMGIRSLFDEVASIETLNMQPKPGISAYRCIIRRYRLNPRQCIMVEDTAVNLRTARKLADGVVFA